MGGTVVVLALVERGGIKKEDLPRTQKISSQVITWT